MPSNQISAQSASTSIYLPPTLDIVIIADLDKKSKVNDTSGHSKLSFYSYLRRGSLRLHHDSTTRCVFHFDMHIHIFTYIHDTSNPYSYTCDWKPVEKIYTQLNEGGRGFELSELVWFQSHLYTVDDRTGVVFRLDNLYDDHVQADATYILMEGSGHTSKGQKSEWATVKDGELVIGSIGKEYTDNTGLQIASKANFWVKFISSTKSNLFASEAETSLGIRHVNWESQYTKIRQALGCEFPAYVIHEAFVWSDVHRKWFILPRRVSVEAYNDMIDEKKGANVLLIASEDFNDIDVRHIGELTPERGFSSFKFVPHTEDTVIMALKSMENEVKGTQETYLTVFDIDGRMFMEETLIPGEKVKYEGLATLHDF